MTTPPLIVTPFAASGDQTVLPSTDPNGFVNFSTGYTPDYEINLASGDPQAKAVERGIQNYLFNTLTTGMQTWQTNNRPPWYSGMPGGYAKYAEVTVADASGNPQPYRSLVASNVSTPGNSVNWEYIQGTGEMIQNIPMPSGGTAGPGSMLITTATDFNTFNKSGTFTFDLDATVSSSPNSPVNGGNQAAAGQLEVMTWKNIGTNTYISQFFRDRNGLGFMRGSTNGNWTSWKIWANSQQYTVGEVRMWSGTASQTAVTAAWGPGWHLCDGTLGTPDLRNRFIVGAGNLYGNGTSGGATTASLAVANLPAHNHIIDISDPSHAHNITQTPHAHSISDPGHAHGVYDPGHNHSLTMGSLIQSGGDTLCYVPTSVYGYPNAHTEITNVSGTSIGIYGNGTGIGIYGANANISVNASYTGITATSNNTGSGQSFGILPPYYALCFVMYTGA